jgi:hypothetical protein
LVRNIACEAVIRQYNMRGAVSLGNYLGLSTRRLHARTSGKHMHGT